MNELDLITSVARIVDAYGVPGVVVLFIAFLIWQDKRREKRLEDERQERQKNADADREVLTNHLSHMIKEDIASRESLAVGLTKLADSVNNFQSRCGLIQTSLQNEVDRMKKG